MAMSSIPWSSASCKDDEYEMFHEDLKKYPPSIVLWLVKLMDVMYSLLVPGGNDWRAYLPSSLTTVRSSEEDSGWMTGWFADENRLWSTTPFYANLTSFSEFDTSSSCSSSPLSRACVQSVSTYAFRTPDTTLTNLTSPTSMLVLFLLVVGIRILRSRVIMPYFSSLGRTLLPPPTQEELSNHAKSPAAKATIEQQREEKIFKFGEYVYKLLYKCFITIYGIYYIYFCNREWWTDTRNHVWQDTFHKTVYPGCIWYYLIQSAYNVDNLAHLLEVSFAIDTKKKFKIGWSPHVRGDFNEMIIHHIATNLLIFISSAQHLQRIGAMIFFIHDLTEVFVDSSKLANFLKWKTTTTCCFIAMVIVWLLSRCIVLPFVIFKSLLFDGYASVLTMLDKYPNYPPDIFKVAYKAYRPIFTILLGMLIALHYVWLGMFIKMGYILIYKKKQTDYTVEKGGEGGGKDKASSSRAVPNMIGTILIIVYLKLLCDL